MDAQPSLLQALAAIVGERQVLTAEADVAGYLVENRGHYRGRAQAVVRPGSAQEVAAILKLANATRTPIVPQGGNTGLVGGQIPDESGRAVVISTERLDRIRAIDAAGGTVVAEAGVILQNLQEAAAGAGMHFPLGLGSQGSCRIGGNISTNAGGTAVLAYGNMRRMVLGLEVVLPTGEIWSGLRGLIKDNTGYDLKQLFIGAEGTLGIVTEAALKLFRKPRGVAVAFAAIENPEAALKLFRLAEERGGGALTAFEVMPRLALKMVLDHRLTARDPIAAAFPWYALLEFSSGRSEADAQELVEATLAEALEAGIVLDATIASSVAQARAFRELRDEMGQVQQSEGASIKHDVSVPVESVPDFIARASAACLHAVPDIRVVPFGHMGDGNIHFNLSQPLGADRAEFLKRAPEIHALVYGVVAEMGGSISAEHGIGRYKVEMLRSVKGELELELMRRIKRTLDPNGIMNPGVVL